MMPLYHVDVLWGTKLGNPTVTRARVHATDHEAAMAYLRERVRKYKRCGKIHGGSAIEAQPIKRNHDVGNNDTRV